MSLPTIATDLLLWLPILGWLGYGIRQRWRKGGRRV